MMDPLTRVWNLSVVDFQMYGLLGRRSNVWISMQCICSSATTVTKRILLMQKVIYSRKCTHQLAAHRAVAATAARGAGAGGKAAALLLGLHMANSKNLIVRHCMQSHQIVSKDYKQPAHLQQPNIVTRCACDAGNYTD
jgi:hypothetical protein